MGYHHRRDKGNSMNIENGGFECTAITVNHTLVNVIVPLEDMLGIRATGLDAQRRG